MSWVVDFGDDVNPVRRGVYCPEDKIIHEKETPGFRPFCKSCKKKFICATKRMP